MLRASVCFLLTTLACAGAGRDASPTLSEPTSALAVSPSEVTLGSPRLFVLHETSEGCVWKLWDMQQHTQTIASFAGSCPSEVLWSPDGSEIVYVVADQMFVAPWKRAGEARPIALPAPFPGRVAPWWSKEGHLRLAEIVQATVVEREGETYVSAGERSVPVLASADGLTYGVRGNEVVAPGAGDRDVELRRSELPLLAVFFEREASGGWTPLAALPTTWDTETSPGFAVGGALEAHGPWPTLSSLSPDCNDRKGLCTLHPLTKRADLETLLGHEQAEIGFLDAEPGGVLFPLKWGDTSMYALAPVFSCLDPECKAPIRLQGLEGEVDVQPLGAYLLIEEKIPKIYRQGTAAPLFTLPDAARAVWAPEGF